VSTHGNDAIEDAKPRSGDIKSLRRPEFMSPLRGLHCDTIPLPGADAARLSAAAAARLKRATKHPNRVAAT
jgi:hypothetical protein